jgi:hypothetical protein
MQELRIQIVSPDWSKKAYDKIQEFYNKHRDEGNSIRDPEVLMKTIEDNKAYLITDNKTECLLGVSFCFANGDGDFTESGGTRIIKTGYGLQTIISFVKTMHEFMRDPPKYEYYCVIKEKNKKSISNMTDACLIDWKPSQALLDLRQHSPLEGRHFFVMPKKQLPTVRDLLLDIVDDPIIESKYGGPPIKLIFDIGIITSGTLTRDTTFDHLY